MQVEDDEDDADDAGEDSDAESKLETAEESVEESAKHVGFLSFCLHFAVGKLDCIISPFIDLIVLWFAFFRMNCREQSLGQLHRFFSSSFFLFIC